MGNFGNKISLSIATNLSLPMAKTIREGPAEFTALLLYPAYHATTRFWILNEGKLPPLNAPSLTGRFKAHASPLWVLSGVERRAH